MKITILFEFKRGPSGGGNQFLKALKTEFQRKDVYTDNIEESDIILFNSYQYIPEVMAIQKKFPEKIFVHRIDGPIRLYNKASDKRDTITNVANDAIADATIFQSNFSRETNIGLGLRPKKYSATIINAPSSHFSKFENGRAKNKRTRIICSSWSTNMKKGFGYYSWLDQNFNFTDYEIVFAGRTPVKFKNIKTLGPLNAQQLSKEIASSDIFLTASQNDPCSNSLLEAVHTGVPVVALNSGGHPEIVAENGLLFEDCDTLVNAIETVKRDITKYSSPTKLPKIDTVALEYIFFFNTLLKCNSGRVQKRRRYANYLRVHLALLTHRLHLKWEKIC